MDFLKEYTYLFEDDLLKEMEKHHSTRSYKEGDFVIEVGQQIESIPFIIKGAIKVLREDANGDDLLLYYLESGDTCSMTLSCCMSKKKSQIKAVVEEDAELLFLPIKVSHEWLSKYESWRNFIFTNYEAKFTELLDAIDALAFYNMEERVLKYLSDKAKVLGTLELSSTHQHIAEDLHSSRVVISRILKKLELENKLKINRNKIELFDF